MRAGDVVWNPLSGEKALLVESAEETGGARIVVDFAVEAGGLCADGHTDREGRPSPLFGALIATRYRAELRYRQPPDLVQRLMFPPLTALARRRGLDRELDRYRDLDTHPTAERGLGRLPERVMR